MEGQVRDLINPRNRMFTEEYEEAEVQDMVSAIRKVMEGTGKSAEEILTHSAEFMLQRPNAHLFHALVDICPAIAYVGSYVRVVPKKGEKKERQTEVEIQPAPALPRMRKLLE
jgi:hypothetical protein